MKFWRAVLTGVLLWVLIFLEVSVLMFGFKLEGGVYYLIHYIMIGLFVLLCSAIYFRGALGGVKKGLLLGVIWIVVGSILDLAITVPLMKSFSVFNVYLIVGWLEALVLCMLFGLLLGKRAEKRGIKREYSIGELKRGISSSPSFEKTEVALPKSVSKLVMELNKKVKKRKKKRG